MDGSTVYVQTWRRKITPSGRVYWAHIASAHPTYGNACIGWQTPRAALCPTSGAGARWMNYDSRNLEDQIRIYALSRGLTILEVSQLLVSESFLLRLMGFCDLWRSCGERATQLYLKSLRPSFGPISILDEGEDADALARELGIL